jgi:hypothetical protein
MAWLRALSAKERWAEFIPALSGFTRESNRACTELPASTIKDTVNISRENITFQIIVF